jgi:hypothetical protein
MPKCGTGYSAVGATCLGSDGTLFFTNFAVNYSEASKRWDYKGTFTADGKTLETDVWLKGIDSIPDSQPTIIDDRGIWLDGKGNILQMSDVVYHHSYSVDFWTKPHSDGTLLSINFDRLDATNGLVLCLKDFVFQLEDLRFGDLFAAERKLVEFYWTYLALSVKWENERRRSTVALYIENARVENLVSGHLICSFVSSHTFTTLGATLTEVNTLHNQFRGFFYTFRVLNYCAIDFSSMISLNCTGDVDCEICPRVT